MDSHDVIVVPDDDEETPFQDSVNDYISEDDVYVVEDDSYINDVNKYGQSDSFQPKDIQKQEITTNIHQNEKEVDEVIVNSHLKEIVDIKNQIKELQDILYDKPQTSGERPKLEDVDEDENVEYQVKTSSTNIPLKRSYSLRSDPKKKTGRNIEGSASYKRPAIKDFLSDRSKARTLPLFIENKRRLKRNEMFETGSGDGLESGLFQNPVAKKMSTDSAKIRVERKTKPGVEDTTSEEVADMKLQEIENVPTSVTSSLRKILQTTAYTPEEKYKVLDARDKLYKIMREKDPTSKTRALVGTCPDMCSEKERLQREFQFQIPIFEMVNYPKNTNLNHNHAVKQYSRSSADQEEPLPHELRPVNVLTMTMGYLLHNVADHCELSDENLGEWYMYMWDRTRALRKELTQQGLCSLETVDLVEQCARFHIHCAERLVDQDSSIYDDKINTENLTKCLQTLRYMYRDLANEDIYCPNESEFVCYSLLLNLNNTSVFAEFGDMAKRIMSSEPVRFALDVMSAWEMRNYVRFFNLVKRTTYLNSCILRRYFVEMRLYAIKRMIRSYCTKYYSPQIPIYRFVDNLGFESIEECCQFLSRCNFNWRNKDGVLYVNFNRLAFQYPETQFPIGRAYVTIGAKKKLPFSMIMAGGELPPKTYEDHVPQNSFTGNGELKLDSLLCKELMEFANSSSAPTPLSPQLPKNKLFEPKGEFCRISKESGAQFTDIFEKPQKLDTNAEDSQRAENIYLEEKSAPSTLGGKETNSFGSSAASIFRLASYNAYHTEGSKPETLFALRESNVFSSGSSENKPKFEAGTTSSIFDFGSGFFQNSNLKEPSSQFQNQTDFSNFTFKVPVFSSQSKAEEKTARNEIYKMELDKEKHKSEPKKQSKEEEYEEEEEEDDDLEEEEEIKMRIALIEAVKKARQEAEQREMQRKEAEEKERKQREIKEREEKMLIEEMKVQEKVQKAKLLKLEELARLEEEKRKTDADFKLRVDEKISCLKKKYWKWKVTEFFNKWRLRTWEMLEERKMKDYFGEVRLRYPAVCTEEHLNGNPYGLVIPNVLMLRKYQSTQEEDKKKKTPCEQVVIEELPLLDIKKIVAGPLELRAKRLFNKLDPFPWKVIFSVPDESECSSWKATETFIEMNFVDEQNWPLARDHGALSYHEGCHSTFRYKISIRRVRGSHLYEGSEINSEVMNGCNSLVFVMSEDSDIYVAKERLTKVISSRPPLPRIPVIIFFLGEKLDIRDIENSLELESWLETHISEYCFVKTSGCNKEELISNVTKALTLAAEKSAPVTNLRIAELADFCSTEWFECIWRRIETCFSNYKIVLTDPNFLLECYNESVDELLKLFTDNEYEKYTLIGEEFLEKRLKRPKVNDSYREKLTVALESLKLTSWPREKAKSCNQFKDQIHQYCMKIVCEEKKIKELKWLLYRIIRTSLLWKGLDIYCNEDIENVLGNFPWIQLFQEISRFVVQQLAQKNVCEGGGLTVLYSLDKMDKLVYESRLISKYLDKCTNDRWSLLEGEERKPCLEHDSVIYAYSTALEREKNKRKRENLEESIEDVFEEAEIKRQLLEDQLSPGSDVSNLKNSFRRMNEKLDELEKRIMENAKFFREMGF